MCCSAFRLIALLCLSSATTAFADSFVVINTARFGAGSFHAALVNANTHLGPDTVLFNIPGAGPRVIRRSFYDFNYGLGIGDDDTYVDGYSQPGASPNTAKVGQPSNAVIQIIVDGGSMCEFDQWGLYQGFEMNGDRCVVRGIHFTGFCNGVIVSGTDNVIEGCTITWNSRGIWVLSATRARIGGDTPAARNLVYDNIWRGIAVEGSTRFPVNDTRIEGNYVGTNGNFSPIPNQTGIAIAGNVYGTVIGGPQLASCARPQAANCISFNTLDGIIVVGSSGTSILSNVIHSNGGLAIDIGDDGVTLNDPLDVDEGSNALQNAPIVTSVRGNTVIGYLQSAPNQTYTIQAFDNGACDPSGRGEGKLYIGTAQVFTNDQGIAVFSITCTALPGARFITATATDEFGNTSEFSACASLVITDVPNTPGSHALHPNVPNPFNPSTTIRFEVADGGADVEIVVFDVAGGLVRTLLSERRNAGPGSVEWNGRDNAGRAMASGVYFYRMRAGGFEATRKMILLK